MGRDRNSLKPRQGQAVVYAALLFVVVGLMFSLRYCSTPPPGTEKSIGKSGGDTIDVAITYSPMTMYRYADTLGGFSYDLLRELGDSSGLALKFHPVTSTTKALEGLSDGLYDVVVSGMARIMDLDSSFVFTSDIYLDKQVLVQRRDSIGDVRFSSQLDLAGAEVLVEGSSPAYWRLRHLSEEIGDSITIHSDFDYTSEQLFIKVAVGEAECAVVNESVARAMASDYPDVDISTDISFTQFQSWICRRDDMILLKRLNQLIDSFKVSEEYKDLATRYGISSLIPAAD